VFTVEARVLKVNQFVRVFIMVILGALIIPRVKSSDVPTFSPVAEHHVAALNSNLPYTAGFHVIEDDLSARETVNATTVTISFPATEPQYFPSSSWIGGGMFVQAQDHVFRNVDYGFYMMAVLDASGGLFIDLGLHQTEEETPPIHTCMSTLVYAYTWRLDGIDKSSSITLVQSWIGGGVVEYSASVSSSKETLVQVNVTAIPNCQNIIPKFYAGNVVIDPFPFSRYINYFQFGVISSQTISDTHWHVDVKDPELFTQTGWSLIGKAWSLEGDHSYLDHDLMWGGAAYSGVRAQYYRHPLSNPYEIVFSHDGQALAAGTVFWDVPGTSKNENESFATENQDLVTFTRHFWPVLTAGLGMVWLAAFLLVRRERMKTSRP
jgi:hypothetical protein